MSETPPPTGARKRLEDPALPPATLAHAARAAAALPALTPGRSDIRQLFILFYFLLDDSCVTTRNNHVRVDLHQVHALCEAMRATLNGREHTAGAFPAASLFQDFWLALKPRAAAEDLTRLRTVLTEMAEALEVKYRAIALQRFPPCDEFKIIRRRVPALAVLELERVLHRFPRPGGEYAAATAAVADVMSWTNDIHSCRKEQLEGFNLVLILTRSHHVPLYQADATVREMINQRRNDWISEKRVLWSSSTEPTPRVLTLYTQILEAIAPLHATAPRYTSRSG